MSGLASVLDAQSPTRLNDLGGRWDKAILTACHQLTLLDSTQSGRVRREINRDRSWALIGWAERMASLGVRTQSREVLVLALVGLSFFDQAVIDSRDAEVVYALLVRATALIGDDPKQVADLAAQQSDPPGREWLLGRMPQPHSAVPPTHSEEGEGSRFGFRRRESDWDPEAELSEFADDA